MYRSNIADFIYSQEISIDNRTHNCKCSTSCLHYSMVPSTTLSFTTIIITAYTLTSVFGHVFVFNRFIDRLKADIQCNRARNTNAPSPIPLWTNKKHIPVYHEDIRTDHFIQSDRSFFERPEQLSTTSILCFHAQILFSCNIHSHSPPSFSNFLRNS
jgi:hypothetical protein